MMAGYAAALVGVVGITLAIHWIGQYARIANISALYLLVILACAVVYGSGPAVLASVLAFLAFDWFFVEPKWHWTVHDPAEWVALLTFLAAGLITGHLAGRLRLREAEARRRAEEVEALERLSRTITARVSATEALSEVVQRLGEIAPIGAAVVLRPTGEGDFNGVAGCGAGGRLLEERGVSVEAARLCAEKARSIGWEGDPTLWRKGYARPGSDDPPVEGAFLPLVADGRVSGVLYLRPDRTLTAHERRLVETLANHAAVALAREQLTREAARARALEEADRLKDTLLSMVSHDLRNPLASIKASVSGLLSGDRSEVAPARRAALAAIDREADRLTRVVEDLLDMSRLEAGAWRPDRQPCPVEEWIGVALGTLSPEEDVRVSVSLPPDLPPVAVDPAQMERVLANLLENALKYSEGPIEVAAMVAEGRLSLDVADRGPGLALGEETQIFEKFYRGARFRESNIPGSGLGLSVCRAIVEAHDGRLTARNRSGGGAVFTLELPIGWSDDSADSRGR
jgi:two-component system sensor histidine kinase KdpD